MTVQGETRDRFAIRSMRPDDGPAVQAIADTALGSGYFSQGSDETILVALDGGDLIGFVCGRIQPAELRTICVDPARRGHGAGLELGKAFCVAAAGAPISSPAWIQADGSVPAGKLLERLGFLPGETKDAYWRDDSLARGYDCPDCGSPPCHCSARIYTKPALR